RRGPPAHCHARARGVAAHRHARYPAQVESLTSTRITAPAGGHPGMNLLQLAWSYLRARPLGTALNVFLLALGVGTIGFVLIVDAQIGDSLNRDAKGIDLVVGAKGSPIQLMLAGIFHLDVPTGNIPLNSAQEFAKNPLVRRVIPLSIADSFRGFWIVGTSPDYIDLYHGAFASGHG